MRLEHWRTFKAAAKGEKLAQVPVALIVDSPWIPGHLSIGHLDYFLDAGLWFESNLRICREFPDVIFVPSWWAEYGMAIEPSACGNRIHFHDDQPPGQSPMLFRLTDAVNLSPANPETDGLMPFVLHRYRRFKQRILDAGYTLPVVAARGPLCAASFLRGLTPLMTDMIDDPAGVHKLLDLTTENAIRWLRAQAEAIGDTVEGILVLDDIPGLLSRRLYLEFAHPYLARIAGAFPAGWVKIYHNDANIRPFLADLPAVGFDVLNWSHNVAASEVRAKVGNSLCLMGNVPPLAVGVHGSPDQVKASAREVLRQVNGEHIILSLGGGASPGTPPANIHALVEAAREFAAQRAEARASGVANG